jgi:hypothetical protein
VRRNYLDDLVVDHVDFDDYSIHDDHNPGANFNDDTHADIFGDDG